MNVAPRVHTRCQKSQLDAAYWLSKAAVTVETDGNGRAAVLGFGCRRNRDDAERTSYFECLEHYYGTAVGYSPEETHEQLAVRRPDHDRIAYRVPRSKLLINRSPGHTVHNATGLAIGTSVKSALHHARLELIERHISHRWWNEAQLTPKVIKYHQMGDNRMIDVLIKLESVFYAGSIQAGASPPIFVVGSCCAETSERALDHANEERVMMWQSALDVGSEQLTVDKNSRRSVQRLANSLNINYVARMHKRLTFTLDNIADTQTVNDEIKNAIFEYSILKSGVSAFQAPFHVVRCCSDSLFDVSSLNKIGNNDAPFF